MYKNLSDDIKDYFKTHEREYIYRVTIGETVLDVNTVQDLTIEINQPKEEYTIGNTCSKVLKIEIDNQDFIVDTLPIKVEVGIKLHGVITYINLGTFYGDKFEKDDYTTKITAYDLFYKMETPYFCTLSEFKTVKNILDDIKNKYGFELDEDTQYKNYTIPNGIEGYSIREVFSILSGLNGSNAYITRDNKVTFIKYNDDNVVWELDDYYLDIGNTFNEKYYTFDKVTCYKDKNTSWSNGTLQNDGIELKYENAFLTENISKDIFNSLYSNKIINFNMDIISIPILDVGDCIKYTDKNGKEYILVIQYIKYPAMSNMTIGCKIKKSTSNFNSSGSLSQKVNRTITDLLVVKEGMANKLNVEDFSASNLKFTYGEGETEKLQTLISNIVDMNTGTALNLTAGNTHVDSEFVRTVIAKEITVDDLKSGSIDTSKFKIISQNGKLYIVDNTITLKDENDIVRVQIGENAQGDYGFYLWNQDGQLVFGKDGRITSDGIGDNVIKNVNIGEKITKDNLDIQGLVKEINDNGDIYIESKTIKMEDNRTLEIAFKELMTTVRVNKQLLKDSLKFERKDTYVYFDYFLIDKNNSFFTDKDGKRYVF